MSASPDLSAALLVSEVFPPQIGGSGEFLRNVYCRFRGVTVIVLADGRSGEVTSDGPLEVRHAPMSAAQWGIAHPAGLWRHLNGAARLVRLIGASRARVVHCGRALPEGLDAWISARLTGTKLVCWVHGEEIACQSESRELGMLLRRVLRGADAIVANSRSTAQALADVGIDVHRVTVVYPGVDSVRFTPDAPGAAELRRTLAKPDDLVLLTVGRLQRRKGHDLVLQALAGLRQELAFRYVVVGDGDERERLLGMTRDLGLDECVRFVGAADAAVLPSYYAAADVFVHPNRLDGRDVEGFGIVFLEAAASALPVIAGTTGGAPEAVEAGVTGLLVSGTDVDELAGALRRLARDGALRARFGAAGRARAMRDFSWDRAASAVLAIHRRLAER